eukprot:10948106-Alexandrium_andersonii.AAC.1
MCIRDSRSTGHIPTVETPPEGGQTHSAEALRGPPGATSQPARCCGRERSNRATLGSASRRPKLECESGI